MLYSGMVAKPKAVFRPGRAMPNLRSLNRPVNFMPGHYPNPSKCDPMQILLKNVSRNLDARTAYTHTCGKKQFKYEECGQHCHLKWRLMKHTEGHKNTKTRFCHYSNNDEKCSFQELGCLFEHEMSPQCKFKSFCNKQCCQFRHNSLLDDVVSSSHPMKETDSKKDDFFQYSCTFCDKTFNQKGEIKRYVESEHSNSSNIKQGFPCGKVSFHI